MVGETGFEPATPWSQTRCATSLRHSPTATALSRRLRRMASGFVLFVMKDRGQDVADEGGTVVRAAGATMRGSDRGTSVAEPSDGWDIENRAAAQSRDRRRRHAGRQQSGTGAGRCRVSGLYGRAPAAGACRGGQHADRGCGVSRSDAEPAGDRSRPPAAGGFQPQRGTGVRTVSDAACRRGADRARSPDLSGATLSVAADRADDGRA